MNYEKIYNSLIQKRRLNKIDRTAENKNVEYHHIIPVSCDGINDKRDAAHNNENYNIVGLTLDEHFFAHLLLQRIYKDKYGVNHKYYKCMIKTIQLMIDYAKYGKKSSKFYKILRLAAFESGSTITTAGRMWVTNGKEDIFLKQNQSIPDGFRRGRTINFTEEQKQQYSKKISIANKGRKSWNSGKHGIYSEEYRKKISTNHADVSGKNNPRYGIKVSQKIRNKISKANKGKHRTNKIKFRGSKWMYDPTTQICKQVKNIEIQHYLELGYKFGRLNFNNPWSKENRHKK